MFDLSFNQPLSSSWHITETGNGRVRQQPGQLQLTVQPTPGSRYSNAQISDYATGRDFIHGPPLRLTVTAYQAPGSTLYGTAGFGFWNHPFAPGKRGFRLPRAAWFFFASPPNNLQLAQGIPGWGWKCMTIDASRLPFLALLPTAPLGFLLMRVPALYNRLWPVAQRALNVSEYTLDARLLAERHTYTLDWQVNNLIFAVDGVTVHQTNRTPHGLLGLIAWVDNQYAIVTPQGHFGFGLIPIEQEQTLVLEHIRLEKLSPPE